MFCVDSLITALNNTVLPDGNLAKVTPLMDELLREYMGIKSNEHALEKEMRIVLGVFSKEPNILDLG